MRGRFLEAILQRIERELAGTGRPGPVDELVAKVERREVPRPTSLGARGHLAARGGYVNPASKGASQAPWRLPPLHRLARFARDWQTSDALRRENAETCSSFRGGASGSAQGAADGGEPGISM
jgi:hypothetical protein